MGPYCGRWCRHGFVSLFLVSLVTARLCLIIHGMPVLLCVRLFFRVVISGIVRVGHVHLSCRKRVNHLGLPLGRLFHVFRVFPAGGTRDSTGGRASATLIQYSLLHILGHFGLLPKHHHFRKLVEFHRFPASNWRSCGTVLRKLRANVNDNVARCVGGASFARIIALCRCTGEIGPLKSGKRVSHLSRPRSLSSPALAAKKAAACRG